jgi:pSer/pThr/pTyr-binding forkhead associated (FHA) protein
MFRIILLSKSGHQKQVTLREGVPATIGRGDQCSVPVPDAHMSRLHAEVLAFEGAVTVRDLGSSNGTFVNGRRVQLHTLKNGDVITVGAQEIRLLSSASVVPVGAKLALID